MWNDRISPEQREEKTVFFETKTPFISVTGTYICIYIYRQT